MVSVDDERAFAQVRFDSSLERIARVDQHHRTAVLGPCRAQIREIATEQRETAAAVARKHVAMEIRGADDRERHNIGVAGRDSGAADRDSRNESDWTERRGTWHAHDSTGKRLTSV